MRDSRLSSVALAIIIILAALLVSGQAWSQTATGEDYPVWPAYHADMFRLGQNTESTDISNPANLNLIWVYPRADATFTEEGLTIVPNPEVSTNWNTAHCADSWEYYHVSRSAVPTLDPKTKVTTDPWGSSADPAKWLFPSKLSKGLYQIWVWVPSQSNGAYYTHQAKYRITDDNGVTTVEFDQSDGGSWQLLSSKLFSFKGTGDYKVELTNYTDDTDDSITTNKIEVVADAMKFTQVSGQEIYASPVSAMVDYSWTPPAGSTSTAWSGKAPMVFTGTVEQPLTNDDSAPDTGAIYCINSVTPTTSPIGTKSNPGPYDDLAKQLGTVVWRYPNADPTMREPLEGPIQGGIYSTPTLAYYNDFNSNQKRFACFVTASDRQVYAIDVATGKLIWKGPGVTRSDTDKIDWQVITGRDDAFGGKFHYATCDGDKSMVWGFSQADLGTSITSCFYTVYAWIPVRKGGEIGDRVNDAVYVITHSGGNTSKVRVDQAALSNQGKWVQIGSSYYNVSSVSLLNSTSADPTSHCVVADTVMIVPTELSGFSYSSPVVDIPASRSGYGTTLANKLYAVTSNGYAIEFDLNTSIFGPTSPEKENNILLHARTCPGIRLSDNANEPVDEAWGDVGASPSYYNDNGKGCLVVPRYDGHITCVDTTSFTKKWDYIDKDGEDTSDPSTPSSVTSTANTPGPPGSGGTSSGSEPGITGGFTSSATMDVDNGNSQLFVGSTEGYFYCLDAAKGSLNWRYPASISSLPLGAFRYSTPVVANDSHTVHRVWCASDDGHIYSFGAGSQYRGERLYVDIDSSGNETTKPSGAPDYYEPSVLAGMRGSIAMDGTDSGTKLDKTMYVGDMSDQGVLRWFNADNGQSNWKIQDPDYPSDPTKKIAIRGWTTQGKLFSSPSITNFEVGSDPVSYVYVGGTDGRIYAFSGENGAWGGRWAGGIWPFPGDSSGTAQWERSAPETDVQFEMINPDFYQASLNADAEPKDGSDLSTPNASNTAWATGKPDWVVTREMKMPTATMATDEAVDTELTRLAKDVRKIGSSTTGIDEDDAVFPCIGDRTGTDKPIYLEWGETINLAVWNLPALEFLSGSTDSARRNSIKFYMSNTSAGSSAGSQVRINGNVRKLAQYTVLKNTTDLTSTALTYPSSSEDVKRCYALAQIEIIPSNNRPFTPGPGWVITMQISKKYTSGGAMYTVNVPIARLKSGTPPEPLIIGASTGAGTFKEQLIGINNPLAIRDDNDRISGGVVSSLAWPSTGTTVFPTDRQNFQAHFNGNVELADGGVFNVNKMPTIDLLFVNHGTSSREGWLGIMDRSAMGTKTSRTIDKFRIDASELRWRNIDNRRDGFEDTVRNSGGITFPWEFGAGSIDYPNIYRQRQSYRLESKDSDGADPTNASTKLSPVVSNGLGKGYEYYLMQPDTVYIGVGVPKFQPANIGNKSASSTSLSRFGFSRRMPAYVDLNGNKKFDNGNTIIGKQNTYIETYRNFIVGISVPPDPKIEVSEQLIDVGRAPHGLGVDMGADKAFSPYNSDADVQQWFKTVTVKNAGNVNLPHMRISDRLSNGSYSRMLSDFTSTVASFPTGQIVSSLDAVPAGGYGVYASEPFITSGLGYTLTKARVGDPDPSVLTIPDKRKWDSDYNGTQTNAHAELRRLGTEDPLPVKVSIKVPLTQPIGTYSTYIEDFNLPYVPVFSDRNPVDGIYNVGLEPAAETSFQLKVSVRENQLTGGVTPTTLPQIDITQTGTDADTGMITNETPRVGDATPAAFRNTGQDGYGDVHLFWSSNRMFDPTLYPNWNNPDDSKIADFANAPWFINHAALKWNSNSGWEPVTGTTSSGTTAVKQWWKVPDPNATDFSANTSTLPGKNHQWPDDLKAGLVPWVFWTSDTGFYSVRHHSPVIGQTFANDMINPADPTWLAWVGTADKTDPSTNKVYQEHVLHYTNATGGDITSNSSAIEYIEHDPQTPKRYPSLSVYNDRMWMFWQSGDKTGWSIDYSTNDAYAYGFPTAKWETDNKLKIADCLTSVSSPNAVLRRFWGDLRSPDYANARGLFDVVYAGTSKYDQTADVYLSRYLAVNQSDVRDASDNSSLQTAIAEAFPSRMAQPLPRIYSEKLVRDSKYGYFSSKNLAWIRLSRQSYDSMSNWNAAILTSTLTDHIGETEHNKLEKDLDSKVPTPVNPQLYNLPYVWVELPSGYPGVPPNSKLRISATDGSAMSSTNNGGWTELDAGTAIIPTIDDSTGIYTFKYPDKTLATQILGSTMVDFSSGIVRFTKELKEIKRTTDEGFDSADVYADYTPQTWRITTGQAVNNSPRAFIEHTKMSSAANPGLVPNWPRFTDNSLIAPVDRLWVFWRKAGTGVKSSTIFYSTYRVGVDLAKLGKPPIRVDDSGKLETSAGLDITNNLGPWEVDRTGTKIYFTEVDERYRSLLLSGSANALINGRANPPSNLAVTSAGKVNPIQITYKPVGAEDNEPRITVDVNDVSWIVEQPEQSLLGYSSDGNINEGSIYAFADPEPTDGTLQPLLSSKIWVFWTSTRGGTSDLFWETLSPNFSAR